MTSYRLEEWFRAIFEPTPTWPNFTFGQLCIWIGANNDQIWLHIGSLLFAPIWFYLPLFGPKMPCLSIFGITYLHLPLFTYIWPNVALITLIWLCCYWDCTFVQNFRAIWQLIIHGDIAFKRIGECRKCCHIQKGGTKCSHMSNCVHLIFSALAKR